MSRPLDAGIADNLSHVRRRLEAAAHRAHRSPSDISLVAVSKTFGVDAIRSAFTAGHRVFGENKVQEALGKIAALSDLDLEWHLIGHLQTNKSKKAAESFRWIESVDSVELVQKLDAAASQSDRRPAVLIQVDLAGERTKHGVPTNSLKEVVGAAHDAHALDLRGLMLVPPSPRLPEDSRPWFRSLRSIRDTLVDDGVPGECLRDLSMGMSHDFEI
ncbi:MAG: YggS family pyridoxal phosphate-dependent enzyme, partial [Vicinamibacterales bacterium]